MATTNGRFLLGLLLGLILGAGGAYFLSDETAAAAKPAVALLPHGSDSSGSAGSTSQASAESGVRPSERTLPVALPARKVTDQELAGLVANVEGGGEPATSGTGTIAGQVFDAEGNGLAGVLLRLTPGYRSGNSMTSQPVGSDAPELETLEETVRRSADAYNSRRAKTQDTRTDANGAYKFEELADEQWSIAAYLPDYSLSAKGSSRNIRIGSSLDFTGVRVTTFQTKLSGPPGTIIDEAILQVEEKGARYGAKRYKWSPEAPTLTLVPGDYEVTAFADGTGPVEDYRLSSDSQDITVTTGASAESLQFNLRARLGIRGTLRVPAGDPVAERYYVRLMALAPDQEVDLALLQEGGERKSTKAGSEFSFLELEPGRFVLGVSRGWNGSIIHHVELKVTDRIVDADLNLPALDRSQFLRVVVQDPTGANVESVKFNLSHDKQERFRYGGNESVRDDDGSYLVQIDAKDAELYWGSSTEQAQFKITLTHEKYGKRTEQLATGQAELAVTFSEPGHINATVAGYQGSGYEGRLSITAKRAGEQSNTYVSFGGSGAKVGPEGTKLIEALDPGMYTVTLSASAKENPRGFGNARTLDSVDIEVFAGENSVQLSIPTLYSLRVRWADGKAGADLYLTDSQSSSPFAGMLPAALDETGFATWQDLKAGLYVVRAGSETMEVTLPCGDVDFEPMEVNAMRIVITDPEGDLARIGFVSGDLVIGADGKEFTGRPSMGSLMQLAQRKEGQETYIVLRDGGQIEITAKAGDVRGWQELGGQMLPASR